jgi:hypothetical protein
MPLEGIAPRRRRPASRGDDDASRALPSPLGEPVFVRRGVDEEVPDAATPGEVEAPQRRG